MKLIFFLLLYASCFSSCTSRLSPKDTEIKALSDSLKVRCNDRIMQTDSLRIEAENFMAHTPPGTPEYFLARQFYINSYFNEKNFPRVLEMLDEAEQMPGYKDLPATQANYLYTRSRCYQFMQQYDKAIAISRQIMDLVPTPGDPLAHEGIRTRAVGAMNNVNNIFYFTNRTDQGAEWFHRLRTNPPALLDECCRRDMMIFEGYLRGLAGQKERAEAVMASAHALPVYRKTAENTFRDCSFAASVYYALPHRKDDMERLLKHAISEGRKDRYIPGINWAMSLLGNIYSRQNRFQEAVQLQYQGLEIGLRLQDSVFCARCYHELSNLYYKWGMYPQAQYYIDKVFAWQENTNTNLKDKGAYHLTKWSIVQKLPGYRREERLKLLATADSCFLLSEIKQTAQTHFYKAIDRIMILPYESAKGLEDIKRYYGSNAPTTSDYNVEALRAIALFRLGRDAEARKTILAIKKYNSTDSYHFLDTLMSHYIHWKDNTVIAHLTRLREPLLQVYLEQKTREAVVEADIRYQTEQKEKENRLLSAEVELKSSRLQTFIFTGLFLLAIGVGIGGWLWMRLRLKEREKLFSQQQLHEQSQRLQQLITSRQELNNRNEELLRQLVDIQATHDKTCDLEHVMESLQPCPLTNREEEQFRTAFASLYPTVLHSLRSICPRITRTEELFCMLIVLKQNNEEISRTLGITRSSVLKNRYRLRTKLGLPEGCDLDSEVRALLLPK